MRREGERGGEHVWGYCETFLEGEEEGGLVLGWALFFLEGVGKAGKRDLLPGRVHSRVGRH